MADEIRNRNVFILGAGFSFSAGAPLIKNFLDVAREFYDDPTSGLDEIERKCFHEVFAFKRELSRAREKMKIDLDNIEDLFGLVEMYQRLKKADPATRDATVYLIAKTLQLAINARSRRLNITWQLNEEAGDDSSFPASVQKDTTNRRYSADIYDFFAGLISGCYDSQQRRQWRDTVVITFNYDLVLDDALWRIGIAPEYHLGGPQVNWGVASSLPVLKLHGSTNWAVCSQCKHVLIIRSKITAAPLEYRSRVCPNCKTQSFQLLLVPPSWDKTEHQALMRPVWEKAAEALNTASRICIIGYSMPESDAFFKYLITLGLADNHQLYKLIVVNKDNNGNGGEKLQSIFPSDESRCLLEDLIVNRQAAAAWSIEHRYKELFESTFAQRRFNYHGNGLEFYLGNGEFFSDLGRAELISNLRF